MTREVEVTREVPITREVPVPVTAAVPVPATPAVREIPVTRIVPVTITVPVTVAVPVTRETPVTRIVTATPPPATTPPAVATQPATTPTPESVPTPTPAPSPTSTPAPTLTPAAPAATPEPEFVAGSWQIHPRPYINDAALDGRPEVPIIWRATNRAVQYETAGDPPVLTYQYQCRRSRQSWFIEWNQRLFAGEGSTPRHRYGANPLLDYFDRDLEALVQYAGELLAWVGRQRNLKDYQRQDVDDLWQQAHLRWSPGADTPDGLIDRVRDRTHRETLIELAVAHQKQVAVDPDAGANAVPRFLGPALHTDTYNFIALSESRTQLYYGQVGDIKRYLRDDHINEQDNTDVVLYASVKDPYQHAEVTAQWVITGFRKVEQHLKAICN